MPQGVYDYDGPPRVAHEGHIYYNPDILRSNYEIEQLPPERQLNVVISGGSMGGLFTAHALQQAGHDVDVFERTSRGEMKGRGAGIVPDPELFDYMEAYDLADRDEVSVVIDHLDYLDHDGSVRDRRDYTIWSASWDTFYIPLRAAIGGENYHMDYTTVDIDQATTKQEVTFHSQDGSTATGDLGVIAEGYNSNTRQHLLPNVSLQYAGYIAWRGIVPERDLPDDLADYLGETFVIYHGPDFQILTYPVPGPEGESERGDRRVNLVWYQNVEEGAELDDLLLGRDGTQHQGSLPPGELRPEIRERQNRVVEETCPEPFARYVKALPDLYIQCIYDLKVPQMVFDNAVILGDAAFFVRPHLAAGTSKAGADGFALAETLCQHEQLEVALQTWEETQLELGERLVDHARRRGDRYMNRSVTYSD